MAYGLLAAISLENNSINTSAASVNHTIELFCGGSKIFQRGEANLLPCQYFLENSKKIKEIGHRGMCPWRPVGFVNRILTGFDTEEQTLPKI